MNSSQLEQDTRNERQDSDAYTNTEDEVPFLFHPLNENLQFQSLY